MEMLTGSVIVPCAFHDFKDTDKPQCMLFVDQGRTICTVLFKICFPVRLIFFSCCRVGLFCLFLVLAGDFFVCVFVSCFFVAFFSLVFQLVWFGFLRFVLGLFFFQVKSLNKDIQVLAPDITEVKMEIQNWILFCLSVSKQGLVAISWMRRICRALKLYSCNRQEIYETSNIQLKLQYGSQYSIDHNGF